MNIFQENFYDKIVLLIRNMTSISNIEYEIANITYSGDYLIVNKFNKEDSSIESTPYHLKDIVKYKVY